MNKTIQNGRKKRILRTIFFTISGIILFSGMSLLLIIHNYMNKIIMDIDNQKDSKALETDVYLDNSDELRDWNSTAEDASESNILDKSEGVVITEDIDEPIVSDTNSNPMKSEDEPNEDGQRYPEHETGSNSSSEVLSTLNSYAESNVIKQTKLMEDKNITNILFIVSDSTSEVDTKNPNNIILLSINQEDEVIATISFSKSIFLKLPNNQNNSLNTAYLSGGAELLMETLQNNFRIKIDRFIVTDNTSFQTLLDTIGRDDLNLENINQVLCDILPSITTNLKENEILSFVLMMPNYMNYKKMDYSIPVEKSYESFTLDGTEVLGIDFSKNIKVLKDYLY